MLNNDALLAVLESMQENDIAELIISHDQIEIRRRFRELSSVTSPISPVSVAVDTVATKEATVSAAILETQVEEKAAEEPAGKLIEITAPIPGNIFVSLEGKDSSGKPLPEKGNIVLEGQPLACIEAMKMFNDILAPAKVVIKEIKVANGQSVEVGDVVMVIEAL